jgi:hypothetical protein
MKKIQPIRVAERGAFHDSSAWSRDEVESGVTGVGLRPVTAGFAIQLYAEHGRAHSVVKVQPIDAHLDQITPGRQPRVERDIAAMRCTISQPTFTQQCRAAGRGHVIGRIQKDIAIARRGETPSRKDDQDGGGLLAQVELIVKVSFGRIRRGAFDIQEDALELHRFQQARAIASVGIASLRTRLKWRIQLHVQLKKPAAGSITAAHHQPIHAGLELGVQERARPANGAAEIAVEAQVVAARASPQIQRSVKIGVK